MSQQPPPYPPSPYGPPPGPPGPPPRSGLSNKAKFWIGVVLTLPAIPLVGFLSALPSILADAAGVTDPGPVIGLATLVVDVVLFGLFVAAIVWEKTRYLALGMMAGVAIVFVLLAGACVVLLASYSGG